MVDHRLRGDWCVTVFAEDGVIIDSWVIKDRTEQEAQKEAEEDVARIAGADDWTLDNWPMPDVVGNWTINIAGNVVEAAKAAGYHSGYNNGVTAIEIGRHRYDEAEAIGKTLGTVLYIFE